jgi:hypothetical protein
MSLNMPSSPRLLAIAFVMLATTAHGQARIGATEKPPEQNRGRATVAEMLGSLKSKPGINFSVTEPDHWTIATDSAFTAQWSFTPPGHYAHPAVVQRLMKKRPNGDVYIEMSVLCETDQASCDRLSADFTELNEYMRNQLQQRGR